jgi:hypothetical protein
LSEPTQPRNTGPIIIGGPQVNSVATSIEPGELFDFDRDVEPVVNELVGRTMQRAVAELQEERHLGKLKQRQV